VSTQWQILKALSEGRRVTIGRDRYTRGYARICNELLKEVDLRSLDLSDAQIEPPTSYTLEEAAAAIVRREDVVCSLGEVVGIRRFGKSLKVIVQNDDTSCAYLDIEIVDIRPAPHVPMSSLIQVHDPVDNPTLEYDGALIVTRFHQSDADGYVALVLTNTGNAGAVYVEGDGSKKLHPVTSEGHKRYARWAEGRKA